MMKKTIEQIVDEFNKQCFRVCTFDSEQRGFTDIRIVRNDRIGLFDKLLKELVDNGFEIFSIHRGMNQITVRQEM